jgi:hypothetical protein
MKHAKLLLTPYCITMLCGLMMFGCRKSDSMSVNPPTTDSINLDKLSDRLRFHAFTTKQGPIPRPVAGNASLKINFKDTLYLMEGLRVPIQFLHDNSTNVGGVYIQVQTAVAGGVNAATYYYDVPEQKEMENSDTISSVFVGFDDAGLELPVDLKIKLAPYDKNGTVLEEDELVIRVEKAGGCGFTAPARPGNWAWVSSTVAGQTGGNGYTFSFFNSPGKIFDQNRIIEGCCNSDGSSGCKTVGQLPNSALTFNTSYSILEETFRFFDNGTFNRTTIEAIGKPDPGASDFCKGARGVVNFAIDNISYEGYWQLDAGNKELQLTHTGASQVFGGYGNPGGLLRYNCHWMEMTQRSGEGNGRNLVKVYRYMGEDQWWWNME